MAIWMIRFWRNNSLHDNIFLWPTNATQLILGKAKDAWDVLGDFSKLIYYEKLVCLSKHAMHHVKINVDSSARGQPGLAAARRVWRDDNGEWLCGFSYRVGVACEGF
ncbi:hypothetical protein REPUB_Repub01dG0139900 [Reevesia pubescens]